MSNWRPFLNLETLARVAAVGGVERAVHGGGEESHPLSSNHGTSKHNNHLHANHAGVTATNDDRISSKSNSNSYSNTSSRSASRTKVPAASTNAHVNYESPTTSNSSPTASSDVQSVFSSFPLNPLARSGEEGQGYSSEYSGNATKSAITALKNVSFDKLIDKFTINREGSNDSTFSSWSTAPSDSYNISSDTGPIGQLDSFGDQLPEQRGMLYSEFRPNLNAIPNVPLDKTLEKTEFEQQQQARFSPAIDNSTTTSEISDSTTSTFEQYFQLYQSNSGANEQAEDSFKDYTSKPNAGNSNFNLNNVNYSQRKYYAPASTPTMMMSAKTANPNPNLDSASAFFFSPGYAVGTANFTKFSPLLLQGQ
jgi:hypothetical protein